MFPQIAHVTKQNICYTCGKERFLHSFWWSTTRLLTSSLSAIIELLLCMRSVCVTGSERPRPSPSLPLIGSDRGILLRCRLVGGLVRPRKIFSRTSQTFGLMWDLVLYSLPYIHMERVRVTALVNLRWCCVQLHLGSLYWLCVLGLAERDTVLFTC